MLITRLPLVVMMGVSPAQALEMICSSVPDDRDTGNKTFGSEPSRRRLAELVVAWAAAATRVAGTEICWMEHWWGKPCRFIDLDIPGDHRRLRFQYSNAIEGGKTVETLFVSLMSRATPWHPVLEPEIVVELTAESPGPLYPAWDTELGWVAAPLSDLAKSLLLPDRVLDIRIQYFDKHVIKNTFEIPRVVILRVLRILRKLTPGPA